MFERARLVCCPNSFWHLSMFLGLSVSFLLIVSRYFYHVWVSISLFVVSPYLLSSLYVHVVTQCSIHAHMVEIQLINWEKYWKFSDRNIADVYVEKSDCCCCFILWCLNMSCSMCCPCSLFVTVFPLFSESNTFARMGEILLRNPKKYNYAWVGLVVLVGLLCVVLPLHYCLLPI